MPTKPAIGVKDEDIDLFVFEGLFTTVTVWTSAGTDRRQAAHLL
jgi:hypothetical protein